MWLAEIMQVGGIGGELWFAVVILGFRLGGGKKSG